MAPRADKNGLKKGAWSEEEDNKLRAYVLRYGHWNWRLVPKFAGLARCWRSCRLRWVNYLKPGVKRGNYSKEEDDLIVKLHHELGNKWAAIAAKLQGRTDNEIKNYWHRNLQKRSKITPQVPENVMHESCQMISVCNNTQEASSSCLNAATEAAEYFHRSEIPILESSGSDAWNPVDCGDSAASAQQVHGSFMSQEIVVKETSNSPMINFRGQNDENASSFDGFEESFWTEPFQVEDSYSQEDDSLLPLEEQALFYGYLFP